jgi:AraC-like DNA-binding protein/mannose-6-phosphate isomerase-like protein (cupin superfamily)
MTARRDEIRVKFRANPKTGVEVCYKERSPDYTLPQDRHDFWELLYVDKGFVSIRLEERQHVVSQGEFILIAPNQSHGVLPSTSVAPFYITAHFQTNLKRLRELTDAVIQGGEEGRRLLVDLLRERASGAYGAETLTRGYLTEFLIKAVRDRESGRRAAERTTYFQANAARRPVAMAMEFLKRNLHRPLTLDDIAKAAGVSNSHLEHLFKSQTGSSVMSHLQEARIQHAKTLLLESGLNISQIAEQSGYSSIHLFSRRFKKAVSVAPSQYAKMVRLALQSDGSNGQKQSSGSQT